MTAKRPVPPPPTLAGRPLLHRALSTPCVWAILAYRATLSPFIGGHCRFHPTCSAYALAVFRTLPPWRAAWLTVRRLLRCHPLGGSGYDPPPGPESAQKSEPVRDAPPSK